MQGWLVRPVPAGVWPERRLLAAVVLQAVVDAGRGNPEAADWLVTVGGDWCAALGLALPVYDWGGACDRLPGAQRAVGSTARGPEYWRERRAWRREDPAYQERERARWARTNEKRRAERAQARAQAVGTG